MYMYDTTNIDLTKLLDMCIQYDRYFAVFFDPSVTPVNADQSRIVPESPAYANTNSFGWNSTVFIGSLFLILATQSAVPTSATSINKSSEAEARYLLSWLKESERMGQSSRTTVS